MNDINRRINRQLIKERIKSVTMWMAIIVVVSLAWFALMMPPMGERTMTTGVVETMIGVGSDEGDRLYLLVMLGDGNKVRSYIPRASHYKQGHTVRLEKHEPIIFGRTLYKFRGYE